MRKCILLAALLLAGCQSTGGTFCDVSRPIRFSDATINAMAAGEIEQALAHNEKGAALCGWKP